MVATRITTPLRFGPGWIAVEATLLPDIAPHLAHVATFVMHEDLDGFVVSNLETGRHIANGKSKAVAYAVAKEMLAARSETQVTAALERAAKLDAREGF